MKTKQLIERAVPFSDQYVYLGLARSTVEAGGGCPCDNCGKLITAVVQIASNTTGRRYSIGTDCTETITKASTLYNAPGQDFRSDLVTYNECARFVTEINAGATVEKDGFLYRLLNRKGKIQSAYAHALQKYFPQFV